jgi:protein-tyrosine phosphatase
MSMIDLHSHLLPSLDDGAADVGVSLSMARTYVADGVTTVACTPHILPGLYHNSGVGIRSAVAQLQQTLDAEGIPLHLVTGADNHIIPDFVGRLRSGHLLSLGDTRYVLVEPPHHVAPARMEELFFSILVAGFVPILTHPERLTWIRGHYAMIERLAQSGVWMQVTSGSLSGAFGRDARYWAERLLDEGHVHILATDAHDVQRRPPDLSRGRDLAARRVGDDEAHCLVSVRPAAVLSNSAPTEVPTPLGRQPGGHHEGATSHAKGAGRIPPGSHRSDARSSRLSERLRRLFVQ